MLPRGLTRWKAATIYLGLSATVAALIVGLMLLVWYPWPYFEAMGGEKLILLMVGVDVVLGPIIVLIIFNPTKKHLGLDLALMAVIQFAALAYGVYVMFQARPVYNVFTGDRFAVIAANQIPVEALADATLPEFRTLPRSGPRIIAAVRPTNPDEQMMITMSAWSGGVGLAQRPHYYVPYAQVAAEAAARAKPLGILAQRQPDQAGVIKVLVADSGRREDELGFLPMEARNKDMSVVVALNTGEVIGILRVDPW